MSLRILIAAAFCLAFAAPASAQQCANGQCQRQRQRPGFTAAVPQPAPVVGCSSGTCAGSPVAVPQRVGMLARFQANRAERKAARGR